MRKRFFANVLIASVLLASAVPAAAQRRRDLPKRTTTQTKNPPPTEDVAPTRSQELWVNIFPIGMQILGLHRDIRDPNTIYARTHRGLYKTSNGGMYWTPLFPRGMTQFLTFAQSLSSPNVMYLGTSDTDPWATDIFVPIPFGRGMLYGSLWRSDNGGQTWQDINAGNIIKGGISQVAVDPTDPNVVYVVSGSLFKTSNGGRTWADIGPSGGNFFLNPLRPDDLILCDRCASPFCGAGCRESTDGGQTWSEQQFNAEISSRSGSPETPDPKDWSYFFFHPTNRSIRLALVGKTLVLSQDDGRSWMDISIPGEEADVTCWEFSRQSDQVIYTGTRSALYVSKNRGRSWQKLLAQGIVDIANGAANEIYAATAVGVFKSPDGGSSWHQASVGLPTPTVVREFLERWPRLVALLEFIDDASNTIFVGSAASGYWTSEDGGLSWNWHSVRDVTNNVTQIFVARDRTMYLLTARRSEKLLESTDWPAASRGQVGYVSGTGGIVKISPDGSSSLLKSGLWESPDLVSLSLSDSRKLYLAASDLYMSDDGGFSWRIVDLRPWLAGSISIIAVSPQSFDTTYLVGDVTPQVLVTTKDGGKTWRDVFSSLELSMRRAQPFGELPRIASVVVDPKDSRVVYVMTNQRVFRSEDGGVNWNRLPTGLLQTPFKGLAISPSAPNVLYLASDHAVFRSTDSGKTWSFSDRGFAGDSIGRLIVSSSLVLAQGNNGIYRMSDDHLSWAVDTWQRMENVKKDTSPPPRESTPESGSQPRFTSAPSNQPDKSVASAPTLPNPVLNLTGTETFQQGGKEYTRYRFDVINKAEYPADFFAAAPNLPPCGKNTRASRTWLDFYDQRGKRIYGFCALGKPADLGTISFALESDALPPSYVYIELTDRQTNTKYKSNLAETTRH